MDEVKYNILCVDDEPVNLMLLKPILTAQGYEVIEASDGREAMEKLGKQRIDLAILDVLMPGMDGFELCRRVKDDVKYRGIPVVMLTALHSKKDRIKAIEAGADDFLTKPFDRAEILSRIKMLLRMKDLHDRLNHAYSRIESIMAFGRRQIGGFDLLNFNFSSQVDHIIDLLIRHHVRSSGSPQTIFVRFSLPDESRSLVYESSTKGLRKSNIKADMGQGLLQKGDTKTLFYNEAGKSNADPSHLIENIEKLNIHVANAVAYLSTDFCLIAVNYSRGVNEYDAAVLESLVTQGLFLKSIACQVKETDDAFDYMVRALARAAEANDEDTGEHIIRVGEYCAIVAQALGMTEKFVSTIRRQAILHDVGKLHIHPDILRRPAQVTPEEFEIIKGHTLIGAMIVGNHIRLTMAREIILGHHERWDGSGYPYGLRGAAIPLSARITNIADQYDALRTERIYKPPFDHETAFKILTEGDGRTMPQHFDPRVLKAAADNAAGFAEIYERLHG